MDMMVSRRSQTRAVRRPDRPMLTPPFRRLRGYAFDPSYSSQLDTSLINEVVFKVSWEEQLTRGPVGEYLEVVDYDPASGCFYRPLDLDDPLLLAQDGLTPSEGNPQFHQQMVYAVAMTTIANFEQAMGRAVHWSARYLPPEKPRAAGQPGAASGREQAGARKERYQYVSRLRIYPHAIRKANAYYNPEKKALLFGYFPAIDVIPGAGLPGGTVFTCLSHDIIAHETTHAIIDGLFDLFMEPSNPDVLAFHEAFADIVALLQHFTFPGVLYQQIAKTRGDIRSRSLLGELAGQFGTAIGQYGGLRNAIGRVNERNQWVLAEPDPALLARTIEPHDRGAILVAAVFDAFIAIYNSRVADLLRIATNGTGNLPPGDIHPDLVNRLAAEAAKVAGQVLDMCIRSLDYITCFDITFGDFLRAIITADTDLVPNDDRQYRVAFIEAFRRRGIFPEGVRSLSIDGLRYKPVPEELQDFFSELSTKPGIMPSLGSFRNRKKTFKTLQKLQAGIHDFIKARVIISAFAPESDKEPGRWNTAEFEKLTGLKLLRRDREEIKSNLAIDKNIAGYKLPDGQVAGELPAGTALYLFQVHSLRYAQRVGPGGNRVNQLIFTIVQTDRTGKDSMLFRGGCTLILDLATFDIKYCIAKPVTDRNRQESQQNYQSGFLRSFLGNALSSTYFGSNGSGPNTGRLFAALHGKGQATASNCPD